MADAYKRFDDLPVWLLARAFRHRIYQVSEGWPRREMYGLTAQIRDAAVSLTANIAEGYGRYHYQENIQFCGISRGSVNEVLDHLYTALDEKYIDKEIFNGLYTKGREVERVLNGYINYLKRQLATARRKQGSKEIRGQENKGISEKVVIDASVAYDVTPDDFEWEGGVERVCDYETGFDKGWAI
jgi:four helix bundle protein